MVTDLDRCNIELNAHLKSLKLENNIRSSSNAAIISILSTCPCLARCAYDLEKLSSNSNNREKWGDSLYGARHNLAKNIILEAISSKFSSPSSEIKSEFDYGSGKLDISVENSLIIINDRNTRIGIEVKSGTWIEAKDLYQILRYLFNVDALIFARIPTEQVNLIYQREMIDPITSVVTTITDKIERIINKDTTKIQGDCCKGCTVNCDFKRPPKFTGSSMANIADFPEFLKHIEAVKEKVIEVLQSLIVKKRLLNGR
ncbi:MAG: hypothetical protein WA941_18000 [Nitrososphaeraceae archaeon]